jgi:hypothetical protein
MQPKGLGVTKLSQTSMSLAPPVVSLWVADVGWQLSDRYIIFRSV